MYQPHLHRITNVTVTVVMLAVLVLNFYHLVSTPSADQHRIPSYLAMMKDPRVEFTLGMDFSFMVAS